MKDERGSAATEFTLVTPLLIVLMLFVVQLGRFGQTHADVDGAARDAARAVSILRVPDTAQSVALDAAKQSLQEGGVACRQVTATADISQFRPGGWVDVSVTCTIDLSDLSLLSLPGSRDMTSKFRAVIDLYRGAA